MHLRHGSSPAPTATMAKIMNRRNFMKLVGIAGLTGACTPNIRTSSKSRKPNILFIMLDDLGKEWIRACGSEEDLTPTVDKLAAEGIQFTNAYSMPQCTPTRVT